MKSRQTAEQKQAAFDAVIAELAVILQAKPENVRARVVGLKIGHTCGRCGGTGEYSYNQMHGTMCYGCSGKGQVFPKNGYAELVERAKEAAADGRLARYIDNLKAKARSKRASERIFEAWHEVEAVNPYRWQDAADIAQGRSTKTAEEQRIIMARADINKRIADAHTEFEKVHFGFAYAKGDKDWAGYEAAFNKVMEVIAQAKQAALEVK